jgi:sorting nexin-4
MDDHGDFDSVSWQREDPQQAESSAPFSHQSDLPSRPAGTRRSDSVSSEPQAGEQADAVDLAGIGRDGRLEVTVDSPLKENDGTKDAYVSYLVTTHVSFLTILRDVLVI